MAEREIQKRDRVNDGKIKYITGTVSLITLHRLPSEYKIKCKGNLKSRNDVKIEQQLQ